MRFNEDENILPTLPPISLQVEGRKQTNEMELIIMEQVEQISRLKSKIDECNSVIQFGESDYIGLKHLCNQIINY